MPLAAKSNAALATIIPTTAMSAPGIRLFTRSRPTMITRTVIEHASVGTLVWPAAMFWSVIPN